MVKKNLLPSLWKGTSVPVKESDSPLYSFQQRMNDMFDEFFGGFNLALPGALEERVGAFRPSIDVKEGEKEIVVKAELPGLEEKDIEVLLAEDTLTIKGEKKEEKEDKGKNYYHLERSYGVFHRVIPLPAEVDAKKVEAKFKNGVLSIVLPKTEKAKATGKKISIKTE
jgi:HSP20 family protein